MRRRDHARAGEAEATGRPDRDPRRRAGGAGGHAQELATAATGSSARAITFGATPGLDTASLAAASSGPGHRGRDVARALPGRGRGGGRPGRHGVGRHLAGRGEVTLGDLTAGRTLEDVYFDAVVGVRARRTAAKVTRRDTASGHAGASRRQRTGGPGERAAPLAAQTGAEVFMTLRRGETLLLTIGIPVVFLVFFSGSRWSRRRPPRRSTSSCRESWRWPSCRRPWSRSASPPASSAATGCSSGSARPRSGGRACSGRRSSPSSRSSWSRWRCCCPSDSASAGTPAATRRSPSGVAIAAILLGTAAFAGIGLFMAGDPQGRGEPRRRERPLSRAAAARRHDRPDRQAARAGWPRSPSSFPPRRSRLRCTPRSAPVRPSRRNRGPCWRCGRWRPRSPPRSPSAGSEAPPADKAPPAPPRPPASASGRLRR